MKIIDQIYVDGRFVKPHGTDVFDLVNPSTNQLLGKVTLGDVEDTRSAIASAKEAFRAYSKTGKKVRGEYLQRLHDAVSRRRVDLIRAMLEEFGAPLPFTSASVDRAAESFLLAKQVMDEFEFTRTVGKTRVFLEPLGVVGIITPWNASLSFVCGKLATALSAGCTTVIKPSEMSAFQTQVLLECLHEAGLPPGLFNIVNGRGDVVGAEITRHPDIAKISFTGSTVVGKTIARGAIDTLKRVTLELGGKSPNIILDDADLLQAIPMAINIAFVNSGQACVAGTRLLVPESRLEEVKTIVKEVVETIKVGDPRKGEVAIGPMVSQKQYERVQGYIKLGIEEGAELVIGGPGHPKGLESGNFVRPTVFSNVTMSMRIAKEEIFGPVLSILTYKNEDEAVEIANDTEYGLYAYVSSSNVERANRIAAQIVAGRVSINGAAPDPLAPFGGFKQSGIGREYGIYGLEEYVEPKAILGETK